MKRSIKLSRLTNSQLKYLLRHGEVIFGEKEELAEKEKLFQKKVKTIVKLLEKFRDNYADLYWSIRKTKDTFSDSQLGNVTILNDAFNAIEKAKKNVGNVVEAKKAITSPVQNYK